MIVSLDVFQRTLGQRDSWTWKGSIRAFTGGDVVMIVEPDEPYSMTLPEVMSDIGLRFFKPGVVLCIDIHADRRAP
jgi:hypothetical protein